LDLIFKDCPSHEIHENNLTVIMINFGDKRLFVCFQRCVQEKELAIANLNEKVRLSSQARNVSGLPLLQIQSA